MGCDVASDAGVFTITCTECEGTLVSLSGEPCSSCSGSRHPGQEPVHRCPRSFYDADIGQALSAMSWTKKGVMPVLGGLADQSSSFLEFCQVFESEVSAVRAEKHEEMALKRKRGK